MKTLLGVQLWQWPWVLMVVCSSQVVTCDSDWDEYDIPKVSKEDWIDPGDMLKFDSKIEKFNRDRTRAEAEREELAACECPESVQCECEGLKGCLSELDEARNNQGYCQEGVPENIYFRQFVRTFLRGFSWNMPVEDNIATYSLKVELSSDNMKTLTKFTEASPTSGDLVDAHQILTTMIKRIDQIGGIVPPTAAEKIEATIGMPLSTLCQVSASVLLLLISIILLPQVHISPYQICSKVFIFLFFISIPWNWWHLIQLKVLEREANSMKEMPAECRPQEQTWFLQARSVLKSFFSLSGDPCTHYYQTVFVNPVWEVPPTKALMMTFTTFLVEPFRHIGKALSDTIRALLEDLPLHLYPVALGFLFIILIMFTGYKLNICHLFSLEPAARVAIAPAAHPVQDRLTGVEPVTRARPETLHAGGGCDTPDTADHVDRHTPCRRAPAITRGPRPSVSDSPPCSLPPSTTVRQTGAITGQPSEGTASTGERWSHDLHSSTTAGVERAVEDVARFDKDGDGSTSDAAAVKADILTKDKCRSESADGERGNQGEPAVPSVTVGTPTPLSKCHVSHHCESSQSISELRRASGDSQEVKDMKRESSQSISGLGQASGDSQEVKDTKRESSQSISELGRASGDSHREGKDTTREDKVSTESCATCPEVSLRPLVACPEV